MASPDSTAGFEPVRPVSQDRIQALEAYLAQAQPTSAPKSHNSGELLRTIVGIPLLGGASFYCFNTGRPILGVFLIVCLAFAILIVFATVKDGGAQTSDAQSTQVSVVERLRAEGTLDAMANDFPVEPQVPGDHIRFGDHNAFDHDQHAIYPYSQMRNINLKEIVNKNNDVVSLILTAQTLEGRSVTLLVTGASNDERELVNSVQRRILR